MIHGRHARPFPEALPGKRGEQWDIRLTDQLLGMTDMAGHRMTVPTGLRRRAFSVRLQQLAHAAQSPIGKVSDLAKKNEVNVEAPVAGRRSSHQLRHRAESERRA